MDKIEFGKDHFWFSYKKNCGTKSYNELVVIEYQKPYIVLYVGSNKLLFQMNLCDVLECLPSYFLLINRKTIINIQHAIGIVVHEKRHYIQLDNDEFYEISIRRVTMIKKAFMLKQTEKII